MPDSVRLSALDAMFVGIETTQLHMHVGAMLVFDAGPLATENGGIDFPRLSSYLEQALVSLPNYHRRLKKTPGFRHPVWVDDEHFHIDYHLRHTALPRPGDDRQLKRLAGRIFSQSLDRSRPLWEIWVVEGLSNDRFALICKVHHAMVDGMGGVEVMAGFLRVTADDKFESRKEAWVADTAPNALDLVRDEIRHRSMGLRALVERGRHTWMRVRSGEGGDAKNTASGMLRLLRTGLAPAPATTINPRNVGPHRRFDVCRYPLMEIKAIKASLGGKVNDAMLALCAGALRRFLERRGDLPSELTTFRVMMPVSTRGRPVGGGANSGNQVALTMLELPIHISDPFARYQAILAATRELKTKSYQVEGTALLEELSDVTTDTFLIEGVRAAGAIRPFNVIITNIAGPPFPLYLLGARLRHMFPLVPLFHQQGLGIALCSYAGTMAIGLGADRQAVPNLHQLVEDFDDAFEELRDMAANEEG